MYYYCFADFMKLMVLSDKGMSLMLNKTV